MTDTERPPLTLELPPAPEFIGVARLFAAAVARHFGCDEERVEDLKVAVSEACTNSVKAHRDKAIDDPVRVRARSDGDVLVFEIEDRGGGFDAARAVDDATTPPQGLLEGSLGLTLVRALFPKTEIEEADAGTLVRLFVEPSEAS